MRRPLLSSPHSRPCVSRLRRVPAAAAAPPGTVAYEPPVDAPVIDPFRPPAVALRTRQPRHRVRHGAGHAGAGGGRRRGHLRRPGRGIAGTSRSCMPTGCAPSYSFLASASVRRGAHRRARRRSSGVTGSRPFHFGVRAGDVYIDPATLFGGPPQRPPRARDRARPRSEADERRALDVVARPSGRRRRSARHALGARGRRGRGRRAVDGRRSPRSVAPLLAGAGGGALATTAERRAAAGSPWRRAMATVEWHRGRGRRCTPPTPTAAATERRHRRAGRRARSVERRRRRRRRRHGGARLRARRRRRGSPTEAATVDHDAVRRLPTPHGRHPRESARRLRGAARATSPYEHPGVPVDVIAHSQGGLVVRGVRWRRVRRARSALPPIGTVVTLGTPHHGADLATAVAGRRRAPGGRAGSTAGRRRRPAGLDPERGRRSRQLSGSRPSSDARPTARCPGRAGRVDRAPRATSSCPPHRSTSRRRPTWSSPLGGRPTPTTGCPGSAAATAGDRAWPSRRLAPRRARALDDVLAGHRGRTIRRRPRTRSAAAVDAAGWP